LAVGGAQTYYINTGTSNLNALTLAGDLIIDTTDLFVDVSENKIGIGTVANFLSVGFNKFSSLVFYFLLFWILPVDKAGLVFIALGFYFYYNYFFIFWDSHFNSAFYCLLSR